MLNQEKKDKIRIALAKYDWDDLIWVEKQIQRLKPNARGFRTYRTDTPYETKEAIAALSNFFDEAANQGP